jgi:hypothetical protein
MQAAFPELSTTTNHAQTLIGAKYAPGNKIVLSPDTKVRQGHVRNKRLHIVCERHCNNGWISRLEDETKSFLVPLMSGEQHVLTSSEQERFALWLAIMTIVWEYTDRKYQAVPSSDRAYICQHRRPPPDWSMWIGAYSGVNWQTRYNHSGSQVRSSQHLRPGFVDAGSLNTNTPNYQISTFCTAGLFLHATSSTVRGIADSEKSRSFPKLSRLWPTTGFAIRWPPAVPMTDQDVDKIADRLKAASLDSTSNIRW